MHSWAHSVLGRIASRRQSSNNLLRAHQAQRFVDQMRPPPTELEIIPFHLQRPKELRARQRNYARDDANANPSATDA